MKHNGLYAVFFSLMTVTAPLWVCAAEHERLYNQQERVALKLMKLMVKAEQENEQRSSDIKDLYRELLDTETEDDAHKAPRESIYPPSPLDVLFTGDFLNFLANNLHNIDGNLNVNGNITATGTISDPLGSIGDLAAYGNWINLTAEIVPDNVLFTFPTATATPSHVSINGGFNVFTIDQAGLYEISYAFSYQVTNNASITLEKSTDGGFTWNPVPGGSVTTFSTTTVTNLNGLNVFCSTLVDVTVGNQFRVINSGGFFAISTLTNGLTTAAAITFKRIHG